MIALEDLKSLFTESPNAYLVLLPDAPRYTIAAANKSFLKYAHAKEEEIVGKGIFEAFPGSSEGNEANGTSKVIKAIRSSLDQALLLKKPAKGVIQRYEVENAGRYETRFWAYDMFPLLDEHRQVKFIVQNLVDITGSLAARDESENQPTSDLNFQDNLYHDYPDAIGSLDLNGNFLSANKVLLNFAECPKEKLLSSSFISFIADIDFERVFTYFQHAAHGEIQNFEARAVGALGTEYTLNITGLPIIINQEIVGVQIIARDITALKKAEKQLDTQRQNAEKQLFLEKEKYRKLFNLTPIPKWVYDVDTLEFLDVNESGIELYGYTREEFLSMKLTDLWLPEDSKVLKELLEKREKSGKFTSSVVRHVKKSGEIISVTTVSNSITLENRNSQVVSVTDVTEKLKTQQQLETSEQRFKALVQDGCDMIAILDEVANYSYVSPTSKAILGIDAEFFIGKNAFDFIHEDDRPRLASLLASASVGTSIKIPPFRFLDADNNYRWIETIITNMIDHPAVGGIVANSRDVTEFVNHTKAIEDQNERLRQISWEHSHVLRAPLSSVLGLTDLLLDETDELTKNELLQLLKQSAENLDIVIKNIVKKTDVT